jgi:hypothetical protein
MWVVEGSERTTEWPGSGVEGDDLEGDGDRVRNGGEVEDP